MTTALASNEELTTFIGHTEYAHNNGLALHLIAQEIYSLEEYQCFFGGPAPMAITVQLSDDNDIEGYVIKKNFLLYDSVKLFFLNGGHRCKIISVGSYLQRVELGNSQYGLEAGLAVVRASSQAGLLAIPDAASIVDVANEKESFKKIQQSMLDLCTKRGDLFALLDRREDPCNPRHHVNSNQGVKRVDKPELSHGAIYSPWIQSEFSTPLMLRDIKFEHTGKAIALHAIDPLSDLTEYLDSLEQAIDNAKRVAKSIKRRERSDASLTHRFQSLLNNYLAEPSTSKDSLPLQSLLTYLKGLAEMINNWICACTLDEVLSGDMIDIIRNSLIPDIATQGLPILINLHQQAIDSDWVDTPSTSYNDMFCLTSCIGSNCPWQKQHESTAGLTLSPIPKENRAIFTTVFDHFDDAIGVIIELVEQFEHKAQADLLAYSPVLQSILTTLQCSRHLPPSSAIAGIINKKGSVKPSETGPITIINGLLTKPLMN